MAAKYDPDSEAEVISWFKQLFDVELQAGMREMEHQLRDGQLLVRYQPSISDSDRVGDCRNQLHRRFSRAHARGNYATICRTHFATEE